MCALNRMSQSTSKLLLQEASSKPFLIRLATSEEMAQKTVFCKKCETIKKTNDHSTVHCTLAYSRCRCHRVFKYRESKHKLISLQANKSKNSQYCESEQNLLVATACSDTAGHSLSSVEFKTEDLKCCGGKEKEEDKEDMLATDSTDVNNQDHIDVASSEDERMGKVDLVERLVLSGV